ncbi:MAG: zinc ribbon domain-containing protein [Methanomassiliicoccus sp.]|nr:zinc ribbon domain-containing protein [Methanomassiliicoccus sp.]
MPLQRLFVRRDARSYPSLSVDGAADRVGTFLGQAQFQVFRVGPQQFHGEQYFQKLGLRRAIDVWINAQDGGSVVTAEISATLGDTEAAVGLVGAIIYLPLAVAVGAVSYIDYERDANSLMMALWTYLSSPGAPGEGVRAERRCGNCGAVLETDARFCKYCGTQVPG